MSRFSYTYAPLVSILLNHESDLVAEEHVAIYPSKETKTLLEKYKISLKQIPEGLVVLYKRSEQFEAITIDNILIIDGEEVIDKKIVGYKSTEPDKTFSDWLPTGFNENLVFYGTFSAKYRDKTKLDKLALNEFIEYKAGTLKGALITNNDIRERTKPDAIFEVNVTTANVTTPAKLKFKIK